MLEMFNNTIHFEVCAVHLHWEQFSSIKCEITTLYIFLYYKKNAQFSSVSGHNYQISVFTIVAKLLAEIGDLNLASNCLTFLIFIYFIHVFTLYIYIYLILLESRMLNSAEFQDMIIKYLFLPLLCC